MADILTPERVEALAAWIAEARQTHAEWVEHLTKHQDCPDAQAVGDVEHHATAVRRYDEIITLLADHDALTARAEAAERKVAAVRAVCAQIEAMPVPADPGLSQTQITKQIVATITRVIRKALDGEAR